MMNFFVVAFFIIFIFASAVQARHHHYTHVSLLPAELYENNNYEKIEPMIVEILIKKIHLNLEPIGAAAAAESNKNKKISNDYYDINQEPCDLAFQNCLMDEDNVRLVEKAISLYHEHKCFSFDKAVYCLSDAVLAENEKCALTSMKHKVNFYKTILGNDIRLCKTKYPVTQYLSSINSASQLRTLFFSHVFYFQLIFYTLFHHHF
mgnify:CR=1 FL=1